jgi:hypothetical protein
MKTKQNPDKVAQKYNMAHEWDLNAALQLAVSVLSDANWHSLANTLKEEAEKNLARHFTGDCDENHCLCFDADHCQV